MNEEQATQLLATLHEMQIELSAISSKLSDIRKNTNEIQALKIDVKNIGEVVHSIENVGVS